MKTWQSIFVVAPDCHAPAGHYSGLWRRHFYRGFEEAGVKAITPENLDFSFAYQDDPAPQNRPEFATANAELHRQILAAIQQASLDVVISYARDREISAAVVEDVTRRGIPWINFCCDSIGQFESIQKIGGVASLNWFPESAARPKYKALGRPFLCRPYVLNPSALPDLGSCSARIDKQVGFVGIPSTNRVTILSLLRSLACPIEIHGFGWQAPESAAFGGKNDSWVVKMRRLLGEPHRAERLWRRIAWRQLRRVAKGPLSETEMHQFLAECQIVLGLNETRDPGGHLQSYLKFRDLEMPGYGCCYLTQRNADIQNAFVEGEEVLTFQNVLEARAKLRFYRRRPDACRKIGLAARTRVLREHTWRNRLEELRAVLG